MNTTTQSSKEGVNWVTCKVCPRQCRLSEGSVGQCRARINRGGVIEAAAYGLVSSIALDPIEKKPLARFFPGSKVLSIGSFGCNLRCPFCQNSTISMTGPLDPEAYGTPTTPEKIVELARSKAPEGTIGIAYTYNEPLVSYEFVRDCAQIAHEQGMKNVVVTNGCFTGNVSSSIDTLIDAYNIDLKCFYAEGYESIGGNLEAVKRFIEHAAARAHVEITTLIVPGFSDNPRHLEAEAEWIANIDPSITLHLTRFFPRFRMANAEPTDHTTLENLAAIASKRLHDVVLGNI